MIREMRRKQERDNAKRPSVLAMVPREQWRAFGARSALGAC